MKQLTTLISALFFLVIGVSHVWALPKCLSVHRALLIGIIVLVPMLGQDGQKYVGGYGRMVSSMVRVPLPGQWR